MSYTRFMGKFRKVFKQPVVNPIYTILFILAMGLGVFGVYLGSPWYVPSPNATAATVFEDGRAEQLALAFLYVTAPMIVIIGLIRKSKEIISHGALWLFVMYLFATLLRITGVGVFPLIWLFLLVCGLVAGTCRLALGVKTDGSE